MNILGIDFNLWILIGLFGQTLFFLRFIIQWLYSEKKGESTIPVVFWYFSIVGGSITLAYSIYRNDPVFIAGFSLSLIVYVRNLILLKKQKKAHVAVRTYDANERFQE